MEGLFRKDFTKKNGKTAMSPFVYVKTYLYMSA